MVKKIFTRLKDDTKLWIKRDGLVMFCLTVVAVIAQILGEE